MRYIIEWLISIWGKISKLKISYKFFTIIEIEKMCWMFISINNFFENIRWLVKYISYFLNTSNNDSIYRRYTGVYRMGYLFLFLEHIRIEATFVILSQVLHEYKGIYISFSYLSIFTRATFTDKRSPSSIGIWFRSFAANWRMTARESGDSMIHSLMVSSREEMMLVRWGKSRGIRREKVVTIGQPSRQSYTSHESRNPGCRARVAWIRHRFDISRYPHFSHARFTSLPVDWSNISYTRQQSPSQRSHIVSAVDIVQKDEKIGTMYIVGLFDSGFLSKRKSLSQKREGFWDYGSL